MLVCPPIRSFSSFLCDRHCVTRIGDMPKTKRQVSVFKFQGIALKLAAQLKSLPSLIGEHIARYIFRLFIPRFSVNKRRRIMASSKWISYLSLSNGNGVWMLHTQCQSESASVCHLLWKPISYFAYLLWRDLIKCQNTTICKHWDYFTNSSKKVNLYH